MDLLKDLSKSWCVVVPCRMISYDSILSFLYTAHAFHILYILYIYMLYAYCNCNVRLLSEIYNFSITYHQISIWLCLAGPFQILSEEFNQHRLSQGRCGSCWAVAAATVTWPISGTGWRSRW
jgi:hypothetical protein